MSEQYGDLRVDRLTYTEAGSNKTVTVSGLVAQVQSGGTTSGNVTIEGNITVTGTISGDTITAQKALEWGLLSEVVESNDLSTKTESIIEKIKRNSPNAIRLGLEAYEKITKTDDEH